ncbi:hypothetical protein M427DRAFT_38410 [Gonapodya prolifera JEL478]|uniref:Uncharacterized protein n=1 Tax=Gonapodya prolifera (strain JEL478) TaxID=1344416 RepID=A0A139A081_GONPJ|nr:hypothetical protein M427DRAFT_38410 [Gonapodya prolifera JEL478]|eukprot:KXS09773.1 hypothetical protein M427DRAFT_38410 [Gonapodya prolifera JEL478]
MATAPRGPDSDGNTLQQIIHLPSLVSSLLDRRSCRLTQPGTPLFVGGRAAAVATVATPAAATMQSSRPPTRTANNCTACANAEPPLHSPTVRHTTRPYTKEGKQLVLKKEKSSAPPLNFTPPFVKPFSTYHCRKRLGLQKLMWRVIHDVSKQFTILAQLHSIVLHMALSQCRGDIGQNIMPHDVLNKTFRMMKTKRQESAVGPIFDAAENFWQQMVDDGVRHVDLVCVSGNAENKYLTNMEQNWKEDTICHVPASIMQYLKWKVWMHYPDLSQHRRYWLCAEFIRRFGGAEDMADEDARAGVEHGVDGNKKTMEMIQHTSFSISLTSCCYGCHL